MKVTPKKTSLPQGSPLWVTLGIELRNFFYSTNNQDIRNSISKLSLLSGFELHHIDWQETEYDFNRLFVGPMALQAAPYSSVYNSPDSVLMGKSTQQVKEILHALDLDIANENQIPEDHISYEIELCLLLANNQHHSANKDLFARFVNDHVNLWLPLFIEKIISNAKTQPIQLAASLLSDWFSELKMRVCDYE